MTLSKERSSAKIPTPALVSLSILRYSSTSLDACLCISGSPLKTARKLDARAIVRVNVDSNSPVHVQ